MKRPEYRWRCGGALPEADALGRSEDASSVMMKGTSMSTRFALFLGLLLGLTFFNAFVVLDPNSPHGIKTISNAHEVVVQ